MFNSGYKGIRAADGSGFSSVRDVAVQQTSLQPKITSWSYTNGAYVPYPDTAIVGGETIVLYGSGFANSANVVIGTTTVTSTILDPNRVTFTAPSLSAGSYPIYIVNPTGATAVYLPGVVYNSYPVWNTTSYANTFTTATQSVNFNLNATGSPSLVFTLQSGSSLPTGLSLSSGGTISGSTTVSTTTVYNFTVVVTDSYNQATQSGIVYTITLTLADTYFDYTTLLLNGETNTNTYIQDTSTNNFALTVNGSATPNRFSPLWGNGYYGNYFDGSTGYLNASTATPQLSTATTPFTMEVWAYFTGFTGGAVLSSPFGGTGTIPFVLGMGTNGTALDSNVSGATPWFGYYNGSTWATVVQSSTSLNLNTWYHMACVYTGSTATIYVNGTSVGSASYSTWTSITYYSGFLIGRRWDTSASPYYNGYLSNFRFVIGTAVYTSNFTPPTTPLTAIANTILLTCQSANFVDNSTNAFTLTPTGTVKAVSNQPFGALPSGVQNYGSSLFDGSTGYLTTSTAGNAAFTFGTSDFSMECWFYSPVASTMPLGTPILFINAGAGNNIYIQVYSGYARFTDTNGNFIFAGGSSIGVILNNSWTHIALTRQGLTIRGFVNGVLVGNNTLGSITNYSTTSYAYIWSSSNGAGYVSNVRVIKGGVPTLFSTSSTTYGTKIFTPSQSPYTGSETLTGGSVSLLTLQNKNGANNNTFYDDSVNNFPITRTGTPTQGTFTPFSQTGWSNYFNGSTDYLYTSAAAISTNDFTIECWFNTSSFSASPVIIDYRPTSTNGAYPLIYLDTTGAPIYYVSTAAKITGSSLSLNTWYHIAVSRASGSTKMFVNGTQVGSTWTDTTNYVSAATRPIVGTSGYSAGGFFTGYISNLRVVNGTAVYTSNFTPSITPLTAVTNTVWLLAQSNSFKDNSTNNSVLIGGTPQVQAFSPFAPGVSYSSANNGGSMYFNGSTDYLNTANVSPLQFGTNSFTIELWIYPAAASLTAVLVDFRPSGGNGLYPTLSLSAGVLIYYTSTANQITGGAPTPYTWSHVALVRNNTSTILYLNGVQTGSTYADSTSYLDGTSAPVIGGSGYSRGSLYFNGYLSNLRIVNGTAVYTSAFTPPTAPLTPTANTSLLLLGTNTGIQDQTGKNDIITVGSVMTQANTVKYGTGAMYFDGSTAYVTMPTASNQNLVLGTGSFTIEFWAYIATSSLTANFLDFRATTTNGIYPTLLLNSGALNYYVNGSTVITGSSPSISTWHHIALVRNSATTTLYLDGTATGSAYTDSNSYLVGSAIAVGSSSYTLGSSYFNGYIDDLRITKGIARYTANFTPPTVPDFTL